MIFCKNPNSDVPILEIYEEIGETQDEFGFKSGISGKEFADYLKFIEGQEGKKGIDIYINSLGGSIIDGMTIFSAIKSCTIPVNTICTGVAVSMAGVILQAGQKRKMVNWGKLMIHNPSGGDSKELETLKDTLLKMLVIRSGLAEEQISNLMDATTWLTAQECLEFKFIDEIADITTPANIPDIQKDTEPKAAYLKLKKIVNSLTDPPKQKPKMEKIKNFYGLDAASTEDEVVNQAKKVQTAKNKFSKAIAASMSSLNKVLNKKDEDEDDEDKWPEMMKKTVADMKAKYGEMEDKLAKLEKECNDLKAEKKTLEDAKNALEGAGLKAEATLFVEDAIKKGKFKDSMKDTWVDLYLGDKETTIKLVEDIPLPSRNAAKMAIESTKVPGAKGLTNASNAIPQGAGNILARAKAARIEEYNKTYKK